MACVQVMEQGNMTIPFGAEWLPEGTGSNILITDPDVVLAPNRFYRLRVLW